MSKVLIAYSSNAGSTVEVAAALTEVLTRAGHSADIHPFTEVINLQGYDAVVVGAPMIFGWHQPARRFVRRFQSELALKKVAYFACAMRLTLVPGTVLPPIPLTLDPNLVTELAQAGSLNFKERFTSAGNYLRKMIAAAPAVKPVSVAFFNGSLDMRCLKWWQAAFVMLVVQGTPGDYRDWDFIRAWGKTLSEVL